MPLRSLAMTRLTLGAAELITLSDGNLLLPAEFVLGPVPDEIAREMESKYQLGEELTPPCNVTLLRTGDRLVLFDCGAGVGFQPSVGELPGALEAAGISLDDITDIIFTHGHPDHLWGLLDDFDEPAFPNARLMMGGKELDYWRDPATIDTIGQARAAFAAGARRRIEALSERFERFGDGKEVIPGVTARMTPGHTPGHMAFRISNGGEDAMIVGDAIANHHIAFDAPSVETGNDQDMATAAETRVGLFDEIMSDGLTIIGFHLPGGGIGRVERSGDGFRFVAD
jgi:glyoxylase-like metal-dependent hydrolase (beta-lactamase superfamily II)